MRALVTGTKTPASLFAVRRLAGLGFEITAACYTRWDYWAYSNAVKKRIRVPALHDNPKAFAEAILAELGTGRYDAYISTFEEGYLMSYYQDEIRRRVKYISMPFADVMNMYDKGLMTAAAERAGVPVPDPTFVPASYGELDQIFRQVDYPVIIKLRQACDAHGQRLVRDAGNLAAEYLKLVSEYGLAENELPIIQRFLPGTLICTSGFAVDGKLVGHMAFKALRTYPRQGGTSAYKEIVDCPKALQYDSALARSRGWTGFISCDYLTDQHSDEVYLIDCNPRMVPGLAMGYHAGADLVGAYADLLQGQQIRPLYNPSPGSRGRMQFIDLGWLLDTFLDGKMTIRQKLVVWKKWLNRGGHIIDDVLSWKDPMPGLVLYAFVFTRLRRLLSKSGGEMFLSHGLFNGRLVAELIEAEKRDKRSAGEAVAAAQVAAVRVQETAAAQHVVAERGAVAQAAVVQSTREVAAGKEQEKEVVEKEVVAR